jgi:hypothetical protein
MNIKKVVSAVTAFALSATMFAGFSINSYAAEATVTNSSETISSLSEDFSGDLADSTIGNVTVTGSAGTKGTTNADYASYSTTYLDIDNGTATIELDDAYTPSENETVNIKFEYGSGNHQYTNGFAVYSGDQVIAGLELGAYNSSFAGTIGGKNVDVTVNGNGQKYIVNAGQNSHSDMKFAATVSIDINFSKNTATVSLISKYNSGYNATFTGSLDDITEKSIDKIYFHLDGSRSDRSVGVGKILSTANIPEQYAVTLNIPDDSNIVLTDTSDSSVLTFTGEEEALIKNLPSGTYNYVVSKDGYPSKDGSLTVGSSSENSLTVELEEAETATLSLKYVDSEGNELKGGAVNAANAAYVNAAYELTDDEKASFVYTDGKGVEYNATVTTTTVTPATAVATCDVVCTLTEKTYVATVKSLPHSKVVVSGTSTSNTVVNETVYTDKTGTATLNQVVGEYDVSVEKTNYSKATGKLTVNNDGNGTVNVDIAPTTDGVIYYEDFANTGYTGNNFESLIANMGLYNGKAVTIGNTLTSGEYTLPSSSYDSYTITVKDLKANANIGGARTSAIAFVNDDTEIIKITSLSQNPASEENPTKVILTVSGAEEKTLATSTTGETEFSGDLNLTIAADGTISGSWGSEAINGKVDAAKVGVTGIKTTVTKNSVYSRIELSSIEVSGENTPVITAVTAKPDGIAALPTKASAYLVTDGQLAVDATEVDLTDVTTVYIMVENAVEDVMPVVTVEGTDYTPTYKYAVNENGYFIYQFVGIDVSGATVSYTGAENVTLSADE